MWSYRMHYSLCAPSAYCSVVNHMVSILLYRVFFSTGPTPKTSKYGTGPTQLQKMTKYTGPTQSYQKSKE